MNNRMKDFYMSIAEECAKMSRAARLQVGAVVVKNDNIISFSWNGTPAGWDNICEDKEYCLSTDFNGEYFEHDKELFPLHDEYGIYRLKTKPEVLHAERNALDKLAKGHESGSDATMFITHSPCLECAKSIYGAGINRVYFGQEYRNNAGVEFLIKSGVAVEQYGKNSWTVTLEEDPDSGDLIMPLPSDLLNQTDWDFGDTLIWDIDQKGCIILSKKIDSGDKKSV